ncbi:MAG: hypothetical protein V1863_06820 [Candidatus Omnitrophota bacterium]
MNRIFTNTIVSFLCHLAVFFVFVPVIRNSPSLKTQTRFIFLGNFLSDQDLKPAATLSAKAASKTKGLASFNFSSDRAAEKIALQAGKPNVVIPLPETQKEHPEPVEGSVEGSLESRDVVRVVFGFSDFGHYVYTPDFSDLKKPASRDELTAAADFIVFFNDKGRVSQVRKTAGCGDPALDLALMAKLKKAIFRSEWIPAKGSLSVRIRLKE